MKYPDSYLRLILSVIFTILLLAPLVPAQTEGAPPADLDEKVEEYMAAAVKVHGFSGSIMIAKEGSPLVSKGYGLANVELGVKNSPATVYRLGSITKQFTGMAVAQLQERGKLTVDDPICGFFEQCPESWKPIKISHLLAHNSGIPSYTAFPEFARDTIVPTSTLEMYAKVKDRPLDFAPGEKFAYNNSGYFLLGMIIEKVSGKSYEDYLQEHIFERLGMRSTGYDVSARIIPNRAAGYKKESGKLLNASYLDMSVPYAAGALYSTTGDLLLWDEALYTESLAKRETLESIFDTGEKDSAYRFGWNVGKRFERRSISHGGGIYGFSTSMSRYPDDRVVVIVLTNIEGSPSGRVANDLAAIYFGKDYEIPEERRSIELETGVLTSYVGKYQINETIIITIALEDGKLIADLAGRNRFLLLPETEEKFFSKDINLTITFTKDDDGKVNGFLLSQGGGGTPAKKIE
ncbi:MAG: serine hydrolase [Acidobacteria bacterium]|nr:MAG: serine hydrolase [Acidobacteriota bacterium]REK01654.1 MAG: serine hydrolase [Acidobacteriota bacterium]REK14610.1 MAG: serine hydrolase [Acidobacteriota bacterium]REK45325.1 MAG: serine hydrolase [Acidobacteriota bacterium]